jgi:putative flippase GtrA
MTLIRYLLVGVVNTLVGLGIIYLAMYFQHMDLASSNALGYATGIMVSFILNKKWTFASQDHVVYSFLRYLLVLGVAYAANLATILFANTHFYLNPYLSQALDIIPYTSITVLPIYFLGGIQLLCLGIIGEYLAKIYSETKRRPRYFIEKTTDPDGVVSLSMNSPDRF